MTETHLEGRIDPEQQGAGATVAVASDEAKTQVKDLAHHAGDEAGTVAATARQQARTVADAARQRIADEAGSATGRAADALAGTAQDLQDMASGKGSPDSPAAEVVRQIGQRVDGVAGRLRDRGYQGVVDDVARWARAHPGAFLAGAVGAGFVVGRIFRTADTKAVVHAVQGNGASGDRPADRGPAGSGFGAPGTDPHAVPIGQPTGADIVGEVEPASSYAPPLDAPTGSSAQPSIDLTTDDRATNRPITPGTTGV